MFTGLQICQVCESFVFPKISANRLYRQFHSTIEGRILLNGPDYMTCHGIRIYQWTKIASLLSRGRLEMPRIRRERLARGRRILGISARRL